MVLPVKDLLKEPGLVLDRWLPLDGALPESEILLRAELKVMTKLIGALLCTSVIVYRSFRIQLCSFQVFFLSVLQLLHSKLVEGDGATSGIEEVDHSIAGAETEVAANHELRHRTAPARGWVTYTLTQLVATIELLRHWFADSFVCVCRGGDAGASGRGQVKLSIVYLTEESRLAITVYGCRFVSNVHMYAYV